MVLFKKTADLEAYLQNAQKAGNSIGFAPTMGALHEGHIALVTASRRENQLTVVSIFVNPAQFNNQKDFEKYPVTIEKDIELLEAAGCDVLFWPSATEVYPDGYNQPLQYDLGYLETILEGKYRPGHFQGVCKVMHRLMNMVAPDNLYMGQKDYQQCMVVKRLLEIIRSPAILHASPTLREPDGLAMSSRNTRLSAEQRAVAPFIAATLQAVKENIKPGQISALLEENEQRLVDKGFRVDYLSVADANNLAVLTEWDGERKVIVLVAAFLGDVRLIDNMRVN